MPPKQRRGPVPPTTTTITASLSSVVASVASAAGHGPGSSSSSSSSSSMRSSIPMVVSLPLPSVLVCLVASFMDQRTWANASRVSNTMRALCRQPQAMPSLAEIAITPHTARRPVYTKDLVTFTMAWSYQPVSENKRGTFHLCLPYLEPELSRSFERTAVLLPRAATMSWQVLNEQKQSSAVPTAGLVQLLLRPALTIDTLPAVLAMRRLRTLSLTLAPNTSADVSMTRAGGNVVVPASSLSALSALVWLEELHVRANYKEALVFAVPPTVTSLYLSSMTHSQVDNIPMALVRFGYYAAHDFMVTDFERLLTRMPGLRYLRVGDCLVRAAAALLVRLCSQLQSLHVGGVQVDRAPRGHGPGSDDDGVALGLFFALPLTALTLRLNTDAMPPLARLSDFTALTSLTLDRWGGHHSHVPPPLPQLRHLVVRFSYVGVDQTVTSALQWVVQATSLRSLALSAHAHASKRCRDLESLSLLSALHNLNTLSLHHVGLQYKQPLSLPLPQLTNLDMLGSEWSMSSSVAQQLSSLKRLVGSGLLGRPRGKRKRSAASRDAGVKAKPKPKKTLATSGELVALQQLTSLTLLELSSMFYSSDDVAAAAAALPNVVVTRPSLCSGSVVNCACRH